MKILSVDLKKLLFTEYICTVYRHHE